MPDIHTLPLFVDATDDELAWLIAHSYEVTLAQGEYFFREGEPARRFYIVLEGELQISRQINGEQTVLGTTPRGIMGGETFLLSGEPVQTNAQAIVPSRLMVFDLPAFLGIFTHCPSVGIKILRTAAERTQDFATLIMQQEKMAALGKLAAGLAHELNNPAAAVSRSAQALGELLAELQVHTLRLQAIHLSPDALEQVIAFIEGVPARLAQAKPLSTLAQGELEDETAAWLEDQGVDESWELAPTFVAAAIPVAELAELAALTTPEHAPTLLTWLCKTLTADGLLGEVEQGSRRISDLVGAIKSYTYMDRGVMQEVDIHHDLDNTLLVLKHRLRNIQVVREYDPDLPKIQGRGGELNQVWTNLIDNAADALAGQGMIRLTTRRENDFVMVEVADTGPGIPEELQERIFEPFFTTKGVGEGTGLGLDITYRIIQQHNGSIDVRSEPGSTRMIVRLPVLPPKPDSSPAEANPEVNSAMNPEVNPGGTE